MAGGGEDVADLDVAVGDNNAINQEFDERAALVEGRCVQPVADLGTKRLKRLCDRAQGDVLLRHGVEPALLVLQGLLPTGQRMSFACKHRHGEDAGQIRVEQALLGGVQLGEGMAQRRLACLQFLGQPVPTVRTA